MPHPHSLFLLADHHHHHDGTIEDDGHEHEYGEPASHQAEIAKRGPVVQAATPDGVAGEQISLALEEFGSAASSGVSEPFVWPLHLPLAGIGEPPEPPPPRAATVIT
jgi:hypothetical protein